MTYGVWDPTIQLHVNKVGRGQRIARGIVACYVMSPVRAESNGRAHWGEMIRARQGVRVPNKSTGVGGEAAIQADETRT